MASPEPKSQFITQYSQHPSERPSSQNTAVNPPPPSKYLLPLSHAQFGLSLLALLSSLVILGTTADTLAVYNTTHLDENFFLPLWPNDFNIKPTIALIVCGSIIVLANVISVSFMRIARLRQSLPTHILGHLNFILPSISFIASLISISFFYGYNGSSTTWTLKSWSCQWKTVTMTSKPHWGKLCAESETGVDLMVMLVVVEGLILGLGAVAAVMKKRGSGNAGWRGERKGSPIMA